ncbi:MAG: hypothetical protein GXN92_03520 [Candidatus Micrarchaeota archaeon]|nr:hypothetical protein [Candidatus Micrarchaeota archaeon]
MGKKRKKWKEKAVVFGASLGAATLTHLFLDGEPLKYGIAYGTMWMVYHILEKRIPKSMIANLKPYWPHWYNYNNNKKKLMLDTLGTAPMLEEIAFRAPLIMADVPALNPVLGGVFGYLHKVEKDVAIHRASAIPLAMFGALLGSLVLHYGWIYAWAAHLVHNALVTLPRLLVPSPSSNVYALLERIAPLYTGAHREYLARYVERLSNRDVMSPPTIPPLLNMLPYSPYRACQKVSLNFYPILPAEKKEELTMWNEFHAEVRQIYKQFSSYSNP